MEVIFNTALPFFALIFCGYAAGYFSVLSRPSIEGVNQFVFYFALPALLFTLMAEASLAEIFNARFIAAYLGVGLVVFAAAFLTSRTFLGLRPAESAVQGSSAVLGNTGYMGIPLVGAALGQQAAGILVMGMIIETVFLIPLSMLLVELGLGKGDAGQRLKSVAGNLARNPLMIAIFAGAAFSASDLPLPVPVATFGDLLGGTAGPCALFALGATLAGYRVSAHPAEVSTMTVFKLLVHPAAMFATVTLLDVPQPWSSVALLASSLPIAANVFIIARQYDTYVERTSSAVLISTAISLLTVSIMLTLV